MSRTTYAGIPGVDLPDLPYRALADPTRREILETLAADGAMPYPTDPAAYHVHIPVLRAAGLVETVGDELRPGARFGEILETLAPA